MTGDPIQRLRAADPLRGELPPALEETPVLPAHPRRGAGLRRPLVAPALALAGAVVVHSVDHALQDVGLGEVTTEVLGGGIVIAVLSFTLLAMALRASRRAAIVAVAGGPWIALAVVTSHFLPHWSAFSDPYADAGAGTISYLAAWAVVVAGVAVGVAGAARLRAPA